MPRMFYGKLALSSMKRNFQIYGPYLGACTLMVSMFYMILFLAANKGLSSMVGGNTLKQLLLFGSAVVGIFAVIFLFYTNNFLIRRRKKELGLYNILGMEKRHIARILGWETLFAALFSVGVGLGLGILLSKLMLVLLLRILESPIPFGFEVPRPAVFITLELFAALFVLILLNSLRQVRLAQPLELLKAERVGEREPKARWLLALLGFLSLGAGYVLAVVISDPLDALIYFFVAVVLVIIGTYLLFTTGSIALLKLLRANKRLYYRPKPFIAISGMLYRMKQNGVGLANICILSTMVLVTLSTTVSLFVGMEDVLRTRYPRDLIIVVDSFAPEVVEGVDATVEEVLARYGLQGTNQVAFRFLTFPVFQNENVLITDGETGQNRSGGYFNLYVTTLEDYNRSAPEPLSLAENEVLIYSNRKPYGYSTLELLGKEYVVKEKLAAFPGNGLSRSQTISHYYLVVRDRQALEEIRAAKELSKNSYAAGLYLVGFDLSAEREQSLAFFRTLSGALPRTEEVYPWAEFREEAKMDFYSLYGGLFFLGLFLGTMFIVGTVLIIYYKQVTEGYEDRRRYVIMQQVGMSKSEVKGAIKSQVLAVFFLPLAAAALHVAFSFKMITKLLLVCNLTNVPLFAGCTAATFGAFALFYTLVYRATTRVYYRLAAAN